MVRLRNLRNCRLVQNGHRPGDQFCLKKTGFIVVLGFWAVASGLGGLGGGEVNGQLCTTYGATLCNNYVTPIFCNVWALKDLRETVLDDIVFRVECGYFYY